MGLAKRVVGGTLGVLSLGVDALRHVVWFVSYQVDRTTHDASEPDEDR